MSIGPAKFHISSNSVQAVSTGSGWLTGYFLDNSANSATTYFQFFRLASGSVTLGTTAPDFIIPIPAGLGANLTFAGDGIAFTALSFAATTTYNGSTAPASAVDCTLFLQ